MSKPSQTVDRAFAALLGMAGVGLAGIVLTTVFAEQLEQPRTETRAWLAEHSYPLATVGGVALLVWVAVRVGAELLVWLRARRQAALAGGWCAICPGGIAVMTYPPVGRPVPLCWACLDLDHKRAELAEGEPAPWLRLDRPDWWHLAGLVAGPLAVAATGAVLLLTAVRSAT
ncbi:hypothetical protein JQS43_24410 [Natronosporangium hydrolyticum]|uniref:Uncharacterized protein n=1 Tax=Natronosporangium hydrolyticum TaxID=2811111 RepID=A0A895YL41_9ACTN|nr:hypothetical protein [Natronosporangium hydrolyticum]QSB14578.1 hypothetical protein JQS43_24410 [Natronosporangium hydrolyticum]